MLIVSENPRFQKLGTLIHGIADMYLASSFLYFVCLDTLSRHLDSFMIRWSFSLHRWPLFKINKFFFSRGMLLQANWKNDPV